MPPVIDTRRWAGAGESISLSVLFLIQPCLPRIRINSDLCHGISPPPPTTGSFRSVSVGIMLSFPFRVFSVSVFTVCDRETVARGLAPHEQWRKSEMASNANRFRLSILCSGKNGINKKKELEWTPSALCGFVEWRRMVLCVCQKESKIYETG